ncbi:radical SAM protein [Lentimicrobium sp. L6]|uniref:B12-binding domain-containing radical SAM protein n=1 Tax=Lentimicrobium sp. L6 TaxID=2735916 RepID=UPI001557B00C|nr:radical SAM protein [Lentimicrobium sp. L6]NPD86315.1 radical SAM protein [Lentimicrobium sp. L6]
MKILLNCLPPTDIYSPSISLSILKTMMENHGIETEVKYWNFLWSGMSEYTDSEDTEIRLLPFLSLLNDRQSNTDGNKRILSLLQKLDPSHKAVNPHYYQEFLEDKKQDIISIMEQELDKINFEEVQLFGISAKYNQWIPGMILAEEVKKRAPQVKIVLGGFGSQDSAEEAMKLCPYFDFCTWGEGEYPLLELSQELDKTNPDFNLLPRIWYKDPDDLKKSDTNKSEYLDFENYIFPDYKDYVAQFPKHENQELINIPINTIRACHWGKCQFCDFNKGYKLRSRSPECVVNEIAEIYKEYGFTTFSFVDSDTFGNKEHFEHLLNLLIELKYQKEEDFEFWAEMIPNAEFDAKLMEKMAVAGFKNLFIGYDGLSDTLLKKMNKSNSFADNIFFVKESIKNGIYPVVNVIKHVPGETEEDIQECIGNLHYLRFFYNNKQVDFSHMYVNLVLSSMTKYYALMPEEELAKYNVDSLASMLPVDMWNSETRFRLFRFEKDAPANFQEWQKLEEIEEYYKSQTFTYKMLENNGIYYYSEYCKGEEIASLVFEEPIYAFILKAASNRVCSMEDLFDDLKSNGFKVSKQKLKSVLKNLQESYLVYCNSDFSNVVSLVEIR